MKRGFFAQPRRQLIDMKTPLLWGTPVATHATSSPGASASSFSPRAASRETPSATAAVQLRDHRARIGQMALAHEQVHAGGYLSGVERMHPLDETNHLSLILDRVNRDVHLVGSRASDLFEERRALHQLEAVGGEAAAEHALQALERLEEPGPLERLTATAGNETHAVGRAVATQRQHLGAVNPSRPRGEDPL